MTFTLNQIFDNIYPPEAAQFCNQNDYVIKEIEPQNGKRRFQIQELPAKSAEQVLVEFTNAIQQRLDDFAQTRGYDSIMSVCSYFGSSNPRFKAEADRAIELRDATWVKCYEILDEVQAGDRPIPTLEDLIAELPVLEWEDAAKALRTELAAL